MESSGKYCPICEEHSSNQTNFNLGGYIIHFCPRCGLRFAPDAFTITLDYNEVYNSLEYEKVQIEGIYQASQEPSKLVQHPTYSPFFQNINYQPGLKLLDVGCGTGRFCHAAYTRGWEVTGIDISGKAIEVAAKFAKFPVFQYTIDDLKERAEQFHVITAFEVLEHLSSPLQFLIKLRGLLEAGGEAFFTVPNWDCLEVQNATRPDWLPPIHLLFFTEKALHFLGERAGCSHIRTGIIYSDPFPNTLPAMGKWVARRLLRRRNIPAGLWLHVR